MCQVVFALIAYFFYSGIQMHDTTIIRSDDLRGENRWRVLSNLRRKGPCTSAQLLQSTGLSAAAISSLCTQMIDQGILIKSTLNASTKTNTRGRPQSQLALNAARGFIITISITIDLIKSQRVDYAGNVLDSATQALDTRALSKSQLINTLLAVIDAVHPQTEHNVHYIGVSFQGITEHNSGDLVWSPIITQRNIPLKALLEKHYKTQVSVHNDCHLISEELSRYAADQLGQSFATIIFSYGVGLGLFIGDQPFSGTRTSALELGHLCFERSGALCRCGKKGCIEAYAADYGIERLATGESIHEPPAGRVTQQRMQQLCSAAKQGDKPALQAFAIAGAAIGDGLASLFTLLDPMPVALVGRSDDEFELMRAGIESVFRDNGQNDIVISDLIHHFTDPDPLLEKGLLQHTLAEVDRLFASYTDLPSPSPSSDSSSGRQAKTNTTAT